MRGDRIAQLVVERIAMPQVMEVDDLDDTSRGLKLIPDPFIF